MHDWQSLSHVGWDCMYRLVIVPKYRKIVMYKNLQNCSFSVFVIGVVNVTLSMIFFDDILPLTLIFCVHSTSSPILAAPWVISVSIDVLFEGKICKKLELKLGKRVIVSCGASLI